MSAESATRTTDPGDAEELEPTAAAGQSGAADPDSDPPAGEDATETEPAEQLEAEKAELQDRLLRAQAEFQNFRRRVERERLELSEYASMEAVRMLLPILDDFERALQTESADKEYAKGMELIYHQFREALVKMGLEPMHVQGQPFDPHHHHAVEMFETGEAADQTILEEYQKGYHFKGRLLRAAMVKVAVEPKGDQ